MTPRALLLAGTAALLAAPAAAQDASGFRLQPAPTPTPRVVGPQPETPTPRPSPTPTAAPPAPVATPTPVPTITVPNISTPASSAAARRPTPAPAARPTAAAPAATAPAAPVTATPAPQPTAIATAAPTATLPSLPSPGTAASDQATRSWWPWIAALAVLVAGAIAGLVWLRRRIGPMGAVVVPQIERPRVPPAPMPQPRFDPEPPAPQPEPQVAAAAEPHPLNIAIELRKLTLTLMNATLGYRLTLTNSGAVPLEAIDVAADLIGAHASLPREMQLAGPQTELPVNHSLAGLAPGESADVTGDLRVPLHELRPISRGRLQLFVPLARFRIGAEGQEPRCFTLVAGQPSPNGNGAIQPVRLDLGPRIYDGLAGRAF